MRSGKKEWHDDDEIQDTTRIDGFLNEFAWNGETEPLVIASFALIVTRNSRSF
jgi:hypothetical protein